MNFYTRLKRNELHFKRNGLNREPGGSSGNVSDLHSNLERDTNYSDWGISRFSSTQSAAGQDSTLKQAVTASFPVLSNSPNAIIHSHNSTVSNYYSWFSVVK